MLFTANAGLCNTARSAVVPDMAVKFGLAMAGVIIASIIIYAGLAVYNKLFYERQPFLNVSDDILNSPATVPDAIRFFINKNRLR